MKNKTVRPVKVEWSEKGKSSLVVYLDRTKHRRFLAAQFYDDRDLSKARHWLTTQSSLVERFS